MKTKYIEMQKRQQDEMNAFLDKYAFFAFSNDQVKEGLRKLHIPEDQAKTKLCAIGGGGYVLKEKLPDLKDLAEKHSKERDTAKRDPAALYEMFCYELANHEYAYTGEVEETLQALGLDSEDLEKDPIAKEALQRACKDLTERGE